MATYFPSEGEPRVIEAWCDGDWATDDLDRKSVAGGVIMIAGCRMHSHCRGMPDHALSSGESEIMSMSEMLKEALLVQFNVEFVGLGRLPIQMHTDASVARSFAHRKGVGRMKHLEVRFMWLQEMQDKGAYALKKVGRECNFSDMLTHPPSKAELDRFLPLMGIYPIAASRGAFQLVETVLKRKPEMRAVVASTLLAFLGRDDEKRE